MEGDDMTTAYKVVLHDTREHVRFSAVMKGAACVVYTPGAWVEPPVWLQRTRGPFATSYWLTAFDTLEDAVEFALTMTFQHTKFELVEVWECEVEDVTQDLPWRCFPSDLSDGYAVPETQEDTWPRGTFMGRRVKLVRLVSTHT
jgi:hypothetical protein